MKWKYLRKFIGKGVKAVLQLANAHKPVTHPLHLIYHKARTGGDISSDLEALPRDFRRKIDPANAVRSIDLLVHRLICDLSEKRRIEVFEEFDRITPEPKTEETSWETELLIMALNNRALLPGKGNCLMGFDNALSQQPKRYALTEFPEAEGVRYGYVNGITRPFAKARGDAKRLSERLLGGLRIHAVHNASNGGLIDFSQAFVHHNERCFKASALLQQEWREYLSQNSGIYVQFCHSDGASCTYHALQSLEEEYRQRIIVIAIAPATFIPKGLCLAAYHVANEKDPVVQLSILRATADKQNIVSIARPSKGHVAHDPFDPQKMDAVQKILEQLRVAV